MKFLAILVLVGFICVVRAASKQELETRAKNLEERLEAVFNEPKWAQIHPLSLNILKAEDKRLKVLAADLEKSHTALQEMAIEVRLGLLERICEAELRLFEHGERPSPRPTGSPSPRPTSAEPQTTGSPRPRPTGLPSIRPTGSPSPRSTGSPAPQRPTGIPSERPTTN